MFLILVCFGYLQLCWATGEIHVAQPVSHKFTLQDEEGKTAPIHDEYHLPLRQVNPPGTNLHEEEYDSKLLPMEARSIDQEDAYQIEEEDDGLKSQDSPERGNEKKNVVEGQLSRASSNYLLDDFESLRVVPKTSIDEQVPDEDNDVKDEASTKSEDEEKEEFIEYDSNYRTLKRPKKNHLSDKKFLSKPQAFAYSKQLRIKGDQKPSASKHHKKKKHHSEKHSKGGGKDSHAHHYSTSGKKGDKGYKGYHKYGKGKKGHHDKEMHKKAYKDEKGKKKKHKENSSHYAQHHKKEKGKKGAKYKESGEHKKGHSTKGEHNIHKKDEYLKKHEFYDEHHEGGDHEKHGGYHGHHGKKHGGKHKSGHHKSGYHDKHHGKKGHHEKGGHHEDHKGHKKAAGHDKHHSHKEEYGEKGGHKDGKKWGYSKHKA